MEHWSQRTISLPVDESPSLQMIQTISAVVSLTGKKGRKRNKNEMSHLIHNINLSHKCIKKSSILTFVTCFGVMLSIGWSFLFKVNRNGQDKCS